MMARIHIYLCFLSCFASVTKWKIFVGAFVCLFKCSSIRRKRTGDEKTAQFGKLGSTWTKVTPLADPERWILNLQWGKLRSHRFLWQNRLRNWGIRHLGGTTKRRIGGSLLEQSDTCVLCLPRHPSVPLRGDWKFILRHSAEHSAGHSAGLSVVLKLKVPAFPSTQFPECQKWGILLPGNRHHPRKNDLKILTLGVPPWNNPAK